MKTHWAMKLDGLESAALADGILTLGFDSHAAARAEELLPQLHDGLRRLSQYARLQLGVLDPAAYKWSIGDVVRHCEVSNRYGKVVAIDGRPTSSNKTIRVQWDDGAEAFYYPSELRPI